MKKTRSEIDNTPMYYRRFSNDFSTLPERALCDKRCYALALFLRQFLLAGSLNRQQRLPHNHTLGGNSCGLIIIYDASSGFLRLNTSGSLQFRFLSNVTRIVDNAYYKA